MSNPADKPADLAVLCVKTAHPVFPDEVLAVGPIETLGGAKARLWHEHHGNPWYAVYRLVKADEPSEEGKRIATLEAQLRQARAALTKVLEVYGCGAPPEVTAALFSRSELPSEKSSPTT